MFKTCWVLGRGEGFEDVKKVRQKECVERQGISAEDEFDVMDEYAAHVLVSDADSNEPIATGRMYPAGDALLIDRIAVDHAHDDEPYDELVVRLLLYRAQQLPQARIDLVATEAEAEVFLPFGFSDTGSKRTAHGGMRNVYSVERDKVRWHSACHENQ